MIVTLIGYRGTGKTSVAPPLAARLGFDVIDADAEIERRAGRTIRAIFADEGEAGFRARERDVMAEYLAKSRLVIAAGGGAVLNADTRTAMQQARPVPSSGCERRSTRSNGRLPPTPPPANAART